MLDAMWNFIELAANLCDSFLCINFIIKSFDGKCRYFNSKITLIVGTLLLATIVTAINKITTYEGILGAVYIVVYFVFSLIFLRGSILKKIFISLLANICLISSAALTSNVLFTIFNDDSMKIYTAHSLERLIFMVIGLAVRVYIFELLIRLTNGRKENLRIKEWILIASVLAVSFLIFAAIQVVIINSKLSGNNQILLMLSEFGLILINIICLYITIILSDTHKREEKLVVEKKQNEYTQKYVQTINEQYEQTRRLRHDMKQYFTVLDGLISERKYSEARALISENYKSISCSEVVVNVGNNYVNSILNAKLTHAKSLQIDVICSIEKDLSGIESTDLCNLLGNMLDNAIEAAQECKTEKRSIELNISSLSNRLIVIVRNSINHSILSENPNLVTSKHDKSEHGYGIKTIKSITEKYDGTIDFFEENLTFVFRIELRKHNKSA